jgi:hypothetical protein
MRKVGFDRDCRRTSHFIFLAIFVEEAPETALRHTLDLRRVIERWEVVLFLRHLVYMILALCKR